MAQGTTFTLPNYTGVLFELGKMTTKFLSAIGGVQGVRPTADVAFGITTFDAGGNTANGNNQEGQTAPDGTQVARSGLGNVVEIFHEAVEISYTKQAAQGQLNLISGKAITGAPNAGPELPWQVQQKLKKIARMVNYQFINGTYAFPADNVTPRKTRGLLSAITTNATAADGGGGAADTLDVNYLEGLVKDVFDGGGLEDELSATILVNSAQKIAIDRLYGKAPDSVTIGGVTLERIYTPLGTFNIMIDRAMPQSQLALVSLNVVQPVGLVIPNKGILFEEPLAKTGAADKTQIYGELGLDHGPEEFHGKITNLVTTLPA